jgi:hypothetical protein
VLQPPTWGVPILVAFYDRIILFGKQLWQRDFAPPVTLFSKKCRRNQQKFTFLTPSRFLNVHMKLHTNECTLFSPQCGSTLLQNLSPYNSKVFSVKLLLLTVWIIGVLWFHSRRGLGIFLFTTASRTALGPF